jgi:CheY-like chemotaxis protein
LTSPGIAARRKRILIADDSASSRELLRSILESCEYEVEEAADGEKVLERVGVFDPDLVILDLHMPRMDGYTTAAALRQMPGLRRRPIVALTAAVTQTAPEKLTEAGFSTFLVKPIGPARLRKCVASLL